MKNIMICLEKMGIGGVETSVLNQAIEYKKQGINVIIVAAEGIYVEKLKEYGIIFENFEFSLDQNLDVKKINQVKEIIVKYKVEEVIVNQIPCLISVLPACFELKIPYVAYVHTSKEMIKNDEHNVYDWFERNFEIIKYILPIYFRNAKKIIAISKDAANYVVKRYNVEEKNILIMKNSINLDAYKTDNKLNKKEKFLLVSRFSEEKIQSIKNAIEVFRNYKSNNKILSIVGSGPMKSDVEELIKNDKNIKLLGPSNNIVPIIDDNDIILGLDRTILEAISMKKIAVVIGYNKPKQIITNQNIDIEANEGFSGLELEDTTAKELAEQIKNKDVDLEYNYNYVKENLNIKDNIYIEDNFFVNYKYEDLFEMIEKITKDKIEEKIKTVNETKELNNNLESRITKNEEELVKERIKNQELEKEKENIRTELLNLYESKRYKYINKMLKIFGK